MPRSTNTAGSISSASGYSVSRTLLPFTQSVTEFEVVRSEGPTLQKTLSYSRPPSRSAPRSNSDYGTEILYQRAAASLMSAKARPFSISGYIPIEPKSLTMFFRSQSGITHSLDFPIDVEVDVPPGLDVLIAACKPHATCELDGFSDRESMFYPKNLPLTTTLELASHPILDAVRSTLFPRLTMGQYLVAVRDVMQLVPTGGHMCPQRRLTQEEGKVATLIVTLPIRFRGGALTIHDFEGHKEQYFARGGKPGDLEWTAFLSECDYEVETVDRGVRLDIKYNVLLKTYGSSPSPSQSLTLPSDRFLDLVKNILNMSRGQHIAFHLREQYGFAPAEVLAESLVPHLKGGDALLYHTLRLYKLLPELRWAAGGYIWPVDATVECGDATAHNMVPVSPHTPRTPRTPLMPMAPMTPGGRHRRAYSGIPRASVAAPGFPIYRDTASDTTDEDELELEAEVLRSRVESSGAVLLSQAGITVLPDESLGPGESVTKERVPYLSANGLDKLVINVLLVVFVP